MGIALNGIGIVGSFGSGVTGFKEALAKGVHTTKNVTVLSANTAHELPVYRADTAALEEFIPKAVLRRVDHYSRMSLLASFLALKDCSEVNIRKNRLGVIVTTGYGATNTTSAFLDSFLNGGDNFSSPTHFSNSVHNAAAAHISIFMKVTGPCLTVSQFELSFVSGLVTAVQWLEEKRVDTVLIGGVDEYCDTLGYCWLRYFGNWGKRQLSPFEYGSQSAIPGEGAAFFLLSRTKKDADPYCMITSVQIGNTRTEKPSFLDDSILLSGADGHKGCSKPYRETSLQNSSLVSFTPVYGSFPTNNAFDMAAGALVLSEDGSIIDGYEAQPGACNRKDIDAIQCLKFGPEGGFGLITLEKTG